MRNAPYNLHKPGNDYEIISGIDNNICFEIEILCDNISNVIKQLKDKEAEVLTSTYMHQCLFLADKVLDYIRQPRKTTIQFLKIFDEDTFNACRVVHLKELEELQANLQRSVNIFKEASGFIFPNNKYPVYLFSLKAKMSVLDLLISDLFFLERTRLKPNAVKLSFENKFKSYSLN